MANWSRAASAARFNFEGIKTNCAPDACPEAKSPYAQNIRGYNDDELTSRPQMLTETTAPVGAPILSLESAIGVYKIGSNLYQVGDNSAIDTGYSTNGVSFTPFRPNQSPNAYEYVWDSQLSRKVLVDSVGAVTVQNTGIAEPQLPVEGQIFAGYYYGIYSQNISVYTFAGTASNGGGSTRVSDTISAVYPDPASPTYFYIQPTNQSQEYGINEQIIFSTLANPWRIYDIFPKMAGTISIASITYYTGATGRCVVVPFTTGDSNEDGAGPTIQQENAFAKLRRGSLVTFSGGETCLVLSVTNGPSGQIAFETSTASNHTSAETLTGLNSFAICTYDGQTVHTTPTVAATISKATTLVNIGTGVGTVNPTSGISGNPFVFNGSPFREDDYIIFSLEFISGLQSLNEMKLLIDVGDGTFQTDFYYATFRPSDIMAAVVNNLTTLGTAQVAAQRQTIDEESQAKGQTISSGQTSPGNGVWSDIAFPIRSLTRVGSDPTKSLQTMTNFQFLFNASGSIAVNIALDFSIFGGYAADIGQPGNPYFYRLRPRSSVTGAKGNASPTPRYGIYPTRALVSLNLPLTYFDPQADTWDVFRIGGTLDKWTLIGSTPIGAFTSFDDIYPDDVVRLNEQLSFDNLQPFPSIGPPISGTANVGGYLLQVAFPTGTVDPDAAGTLNQIANLLPGNLINIGQQYYTLYSRPEMDSSSSTSQGFQMLIQENAGAQTNVPVTIYQPTLAAQHLPYAWGPDANGTFFAVGDPLRPGLVSRTNPNNPDAAADGNTDDLCPPTEPLQNGALIGGTSIVFSPNRAWRGYPQQGGKYNWTEIPVGRGLAAPFGICTDGKIVYYWGKDGIYATSGGVAISLTDEDLYNIFPHEGLFPPSAAYTYNSYTVFAPDYGNVQAMRLAIGNGFLFADYQDSFGTQRSLVYNIAKKAWSVDVYARPVTVRSFTTLTTQMPGFSPLREQLYAGTISGTIDVEVQQSLGVGESVACVLAHREETYGDIRATKLFGDAAFDAVIFASAGLVATPAIFGVSQTPTTFPTTITRPQPPLNLNLGGELRARALGCIFAWTDRGTPSVLYSFQFSYIPQPPDTDNRFQDWDDAGYVGAKYIQGFITCSDTSNVPKVLTIRDAETLQTHDFSSIAGLNTIQHNGQTTIAYSFVAPFIAHQVRYEPDSVSWREFEFKWIWQPTPESVYTWRTQVTAHGLPGYQHLRQNQIISHRSVEDLVLTIWTDNAPNTYTIPNSGGQSTKTIVPLKAIKFLTAEYQIVSTAPFSLWIDDMEVYVGAWGRNGNYQNHKLLGSAMGNKAEI